IAEIPVAEMDLDKPSVWGSLKQKTRPFLQNLSVKKTRRRSSKMVERKKRHSLDRRLSVSVPDMLEVESLVEEEVTYSSAQVLSAYSPGDLPGSVVSLKGRSSSLRPVGEDWQWKQQESARAEVSAAESETQAVRGSSSEATRRSSSDLFELLRGARLSSDLTEE
ncbi:Multiple C2 and transmembrane domain-containing protein 2, partial [Struthio camelus australis]